MTFKWTKPDDKQNDTVLNPVAAFRVNAVSRIIAAQLQVEEDEIWWQLIVDPATVPERERRFTIAEIQKRAAELDLGGKPDSFLSIPAEYSREFREKAPPGPVTVFARKAYINAVNTQGNKAGINWLEVGPAFRQQDLELQQAPFLPKPAKKVVVPKGSVVMAVIDTGIAVGHELFRSEDANGDPLSQVEFFWNMDGSGVDTSAFPTDWIDATSSGNGWTGRGLSELLKQNMHAGLLDDPAFYASIGATDWATRAHTPIAHRRSHGTHVMGLCAGFPTNDAGAEQDASKRPIIAVNLRAQDVADPSGMMLTLSLPLVFLYILERYSRFEIEDQPGKRPPLVINFSFGNFAGPHDGTGLIEREIEAMLQAVRAFEPNSQIVLPAGNGNQSRCHAKIELTKDEQKKTLPWRVQPGDASISSAQVWLDAEGSGQSVTLTIEGPGGLPPVSLNSSGLFDLALLQDSAGALVGIAYYLSPTLSIYKRGLFQLMLFATSHPLDVGPFAPSGLWNLTLQANPEGGAIGMHAWIERDETLPGFSEFGRQSYFDDPLYARFYEPGVDADALESRLIGGRLGYDPLNSAALVQRAGTLNGFAGGKGPIVIGGFVKAPLPQNSPMALYSSTGLTREGVDAFPDASARSDDSSVKQGVLSAGSASGSFVPMNGTSVSAPQVARLVANELASGNAAGPSEISAIATNVENAFPVNPKRPPAIRSGGGRLLDLPDLFGPGR